MNSIFFIFFIASFGLLAAQELPEGATNKITSRFYECEKYVFEVPRKFFPKEIVNDQVGNILIKYYQLGGELGEFDIDIDSVYEKAKKDQVREKNLGVPFFRAVKQYIVVSNKVNKIYLVSFEHMANDQGAEGFRYAVSRIVWSGSTKAYSTYPYEVSGYDDELIKILKKLYNKELGVSE